MLSHVFRSFSRQSFKTFNNHQNYVKRFYANQDFANKTDDDYTDRYHRYHDWDDTTRVYHEYYKKYYEAFKNKFDNKSGDRQTDSDGHQNKNKKKFDSNSYSFNDCKFHLNTKRLVEKIGYIGAAIVVGLHFETPLYYSYRNRQIRSICEKEKTRDDSNDTCSPSFGSVCGKCKYCSAFLSKLLVLSAPLRKRYIFAKNKYLESAQPKKDRKFEEAFAQSSETRADSSEVLAINESVKESSDPIDEICQQLQTASIAYIDRLNNMLGIALIETDPEEAMKCWSNTKTSPKALFNMGVAYERGAHSAKGESDLKQAFRYYALSASMGHKLAIYNLSLFYLLGKGDVPIDYNRGETLLRRAAELGVDRAVHHIEKLELKRMAQKREQTQQMRTSASAPDLLVWANCLETYNNQNRNNESFDRIARNYAIANRV